MQTFLPLVFHVDAETFHNTCTCAGSTIGRCSLDKITARFHRCIFNLVCSQACVCIFYDSRRFTRRRQYTCKTCWKETSAPANTTNWNTVFIPSVRYSHRQGVTLPRCRRWRCTSRTPSLSTPNRAAVTSNGIRSLHGTLLRHGPTLTYIRFVMLIVPTR